MALDLDFANGEETNDDEDDVDDKINSNEMNEIWIFNKQILIHVQQNIVHEDCDESIYSADWVRCLFLSDVVRVWAVNCQSLDQFYVVHTADQCILAIADTATEPEHTNQSIACNYEEEKFTKFHETDTYFKIVILNEFELFVKFLFL